MWGALIQKLREAKQVILTPSQMEVSAVIDPEVQRSQVIMGKRGTPCDFVNFMMLEPPARMLGRKLCRHMCWIFG